MLVLALGLSIHQAGAQQNPAAKKPKTAPNPAATRSLDIQSEKLQAEFLKSLTDLAKSYEDAGDLGRTKDTLEMILRLRPDSEPIKAKIKELENSVFDDNEVIVDVDSARNWTPAGVFVAKDKPVRIQATGSYKFIINEDVGPDGFKGEDVSRDQLASAPSGALIGMLAPPPVAGNNNRNRREQPQTFLIGAEKEWTPPEDGLLLLKLNVPPTSKCIGKIKVKLSGNLRKLGG